MPEYQKYFFYCCENVKELKSSCEKYSVLEELYNHGFSGCHSVQFSRSLCSVAQMTSSWQME